MKLLVQILSLLGSGLKSGLGTVTGLQRLLYFFAEAILFQPKDAGSLFSSEAGLNLNVQIFASLLGLLLSDKNLLSDLRWNNGGLTKRK